MNYEEKQVSQPVSNNPETVALFEMFSKGYDAGVDEVLDALTTFCGQGGVIDKVNVDEWIATYDLENK
jgi:hypothetical protein